MRVFFLRPSDLQRNCWISSAGNSDRDMFLSVRSPECTPWELVRNTTTSSEAFHGFLGAAGVRSDWRLNSFKGCNWVVRLHELFLESGTKL